MVGDMDVLRRTGAPLDLGEEGTTRRLQLCDLTLQGRHLPLMLRNPTMDHLDLRFQVLDFTHKVGRGSTSSCSHLVLTNPPFDRCLSSATGRFLPSTDAAGPPASKI
jgi:hypothetical protein